MHGLQRALPLASVVVVTLALVTAPAPSPDEADTSVKGFCGKDDVVLRVMPSAHSEEAGSIPYRMCFSTDGAEIRGDPRFPQAARSNL